jgi:ABC-type glycerol-3-phosphate transport system substrate-binding protein
VTVLGCHREECRVKKVSSSRVSRRAVVKGAAATALVVRGGSQLTFAQDKPFAGKKLTVQGPAYHEPYVPEGFIPSFKDKTGADVQWLTFPGGEDPVKYATYLVSQDSGVDCLYSWETDVAKFGPVLFEDITGKVSQTIMDDIVPAASAAFMWQGKQYGVPFDSNLTIFMWNTELYQAAGLDPKTPPQNWAEYIDFSTKLTKGQNFATIFSPGFFPYAIMINSTGGQALSDDLKTLNADSPESIQVLQATADLFTSKSVDPISLNVPDSIEQGKNFRSGRFAHYIAFPNHYTLAQDPSQSQIVGKAATGLIPGLKLRSGTSNGIEGYSINKFSNNKDLALAFLEHTMDPAVQNYVATKWGRPPASKSTLSDPEVLKVQPQFATVLEQAKYPAKRYGSPFYDDLDKLFTQEILKLAKGDQSVQDTAASLKSQGQKIVDDYWASAS